MGRKDGQLIAEQMSVEAPGFLLTSSLSPDVWGRVELPVTSRLKRRQRRYSGHFVPHLGSERRAETSLLQNSHEMDSFKGKGGYR